MGNCAYPSYQINDALDMTSGSREEGNLEALNKSLEQYLTPVQISTISIQPLRGYTHA